MFVVSFGVSGKILHAIQMTPGSEGAADLCLVDPITPARWYTWSPFKMLKVSTIHSGYHCTSFLSISQAHALFIPIYVACHSCLAAKAALPNWQPPLSTRGRYVVDANGNRFKLKSGSWNGGSGSYSGSGDINDNANHHSNQNSHTMPLGLQYIPIDTILDTFEDYGINSIRLQFSNEMIHDTSIVKDEWDSQSFLNNHTIKSKWCCGVADGNERWNESQSWDTRYKMNPKVVGADLYNEVRRDIFSDPEWGNREWHRLVDLHLSKPAIVFYSRRIPDILIIVEGINWVGIPSGGISHTLLNSNKLVYSAHFYGYTGPNHSGATGIGETNRPTQDLFNTYRAQAAMSEFGVSGRGVSDSEKAWFLNTLEYLTTNDIDFAVWSLVTRWHMLNIDHADFVQSFTQRGRGDWDSGARKAMCPDGQRIIGMANSKRRGLCTDANSSLYSWNDAKETTTVWTEQYVDNDWASGYTKYQCPENHYLVGYAFRDAKVSTVLCAKASKTLGKSSSETVWFDRGDNRRDSAGADFANSDYKGQCTKEEYIAGVAFTTRIGKQGKPDAILCRK
ncbi:cellulase [Flagelloscypha sp. PMI_526]|nr:cellulase [Flagelloscypha sp. PMI_526]